MNEPNYYAIIPADVRYSKITANAKLLYGEITALANKEGFCWASNNYFAELYGVTNRSVSNWVKELTDQGFVTYEIENENLRKIFLTLGSKLRTPTKKTSCPPRKKLLHNNTMNNTIKTLSSGTEKFNEIKAHPVFQQQRSIRFAKLTDEQIISTLDIALVDNKRLSFASCINWLETENSKIKKQEIRQAKYKSKEIFKPYYREYETREAYEKAIEDARHNGLIVEPEPLPDNAGRFWGEVQGNYGSIIKSVNSQTYIDKDQKKNELYNQINNLK